MIQSMPLTWDSPHSFMPQTSQLFLLLFFVLILVLLLLYGKVSAYFLEFVAVFHFLWLCDLILLYFYTHILSSFWTHLFVWFPLNFLIRSLHCFNLSSSLHDFTLQFVFTDFIACLKFLNLFYHFSQPNICVAWLRNLSLMILVHVLLKLLALHNLQVPNYSPIHKTEVTTHGIPIHL